MNRLEETDAKVSIGKQFRKNYTTFFTWMGIFSPYLLGH